MSNEKEIQHLREIAARPPAGRALGYIKLTGPGLLQSAMTLGAGSAAASVVAGASFGYKLLWVQPVAMFLGIMMFVALSNIVLTTKERPYWGFMKEVGKIWGPLTALVFFWALGSVLASIIWHFPQYGLAAGAVRSVAEIFAPGAVLQTEDGFTQLGYIVSFSAGLVILCINILVVFNYGRGGVGIKVYEWFLRCMIGLVFLTFLLVVLLNFHKIDWLELGKGFCGWYAMDIFFSPNTDPAAVTMVLGMLGAAVGINMTFMYPYSLLKKNWGPEHKTLAKWDLAMTMFIPFTLITSLIMVGMTVSGVYDGSDVVNRAISPLGAAKALEGGFISREVATVIFCGGLIGMTFGAISAHMTCCGFVLNEMFGLEPTTWRFRLFALAPSIGIFGVVFQLPFWFPVLASAICLTMLPIAYLLFLLLNNRRSYIGEAVGRGWTRLVFNILLVVALCMASIGAYINVKARAIDPVVNYVKERMFGETITENSDKTDQNDWKPIFDGESLAGWSVPEYSGNGVVEVQDGKIIIGRGIMMTGIRYDEDFPKINYEIQYEARRTQGYDFFAACTFPVEDSFCTFINGGWGGGTTGLSNVDGYDASENPTSTYFNYRDNVWHRFRIHVTYSRICVWIAPQNREGEWEAEQLVINVDRTGKEFSTRFEVDRYKPLGFTSWSTEGELRDIRYRVVHDDTNE